MDRAAQARALKIAKGQHPAGTAAPIKAPAPEPMPVSRPQVLESSFAPSSVFDPAEHSVADVLAYIDEHPDDAVRVLMAESEGKSRKSIIARGE